MTLTASLHSTCSVGTRRQRLQYRQVQLTTVLFYHDRFLFSRKSTQCVARSSDCTNHLLQEGNTDGASTLPAFIYDGRAEKRICKAYILGFLFSTLYISLTLFHTVRLLCYLAKSHNCFYLAIVSEFVATIMYLQRWKMMTILRGSITDSVICYTAGFEATKNCFPTHYRATIVDENL
jgi:hypothetical protein